MSTEHNSLILRIHERDAVPVRALPYISGWWPLFPDELAQQFARQADYGLERMEDVTAFLRVGSSYREVLPKEWDAVVVQLDGLKHRLQLKFPENTDAGYSAWREESPKLLPAGAFVWKDKFEVAYNRDYAPGSLRAPIRAFPRPGDGQLTFSPILPTHTAALVLEGFPTTKPPTTKSELTRVRTPRRHDAIQWLIERIWRGAEEKNNVEAMWSSLTHLAKSEKPRAPLIEYVAGEGIKWEGDEVHILRKEAFRKRITRLNAIAS